jgi:hypothetical protein
VIAAAISPATIGIVVLVLATAEQPLRRASAFAAGFGLVLVALSVAGLLILRHARASVDAGSPLFAWIDISMGILLLASIAVSLTRESEIDEQQKRLRGAPVAAFLGFGMLMMLSNLNTLAVAVSMLHEIAIAEVSAVQRGLTLAVVDAVIMLPVVAPIAFCALAPATADRVLPRIRAGVDRYGFKVGVAVFAAIGVYLLIEGFGHL